MNIYKKNSQKDFAQNCDRLEAAELKITLICVALVKFCFGLLLVWFPNPLAVGDPGYLLLVIKLRRDYCTWQQCLEDNIIPDSQAILHSNFLIEEPSLDKLSLRLLLGVRTKERLHDLERVYMI